MIKKHTINYDNGLKHLHFEVPFLKTVSIAFYIKAGKANEYNPKLWGISHFLEHMVFNGSKKYKDFDETSNLASQNGIYQNAWTFCSMTNYYHLCPKENVDIGFDILFDRVFNPLLQNKTTENEKKIIIEEIKMHDNDPQSVLDQEIDNQLFYHTTYAHNTAGTVESVSGITSSSLRDYHSTYYVPNNTFFISYGGCSLDEIKKITEKKLSKLKSQDLPEHNINNDFEGETKKEIIIKKDIPNYLYVYGCKLPEVNSLDELLSSIFFVAIMGDGKSSRLFQRLIMKDNLVSDYALYNFSFRDLSVLGFVTSIGKSATKYKRLRNIFKEMLMEMLNTKPSDEEFERAKNYILSTFYNDLESTRYISSTSLYNLPIVQFQRGIETDPETLTDLINNFDSDKLYKLWCGMIDTQSSHDGFVIPESE